MWNQCFLLVFLRNKNTPIFNGERPLFFCQKFRCEKNAKLFFTPQKRPKMLKNEGFWGVFGRFWGVFVSHETHPYCPIVPRETYVFCTKITLLKWFPVDHWVILLFLIFCGCCERVFVVFFVDFPPFDTVLRKIAGLFLPKIRQNDLWNIF